MDFTFADPRAREHASLIHHLSRDLSLIEQLKAPGIWDIVNAPVIDDWQIAARSEPALLGIVSGHPLLADGPALTSSLHYLDIRAGYARSLSRWYKLGRPG